LFYFRAYNGDSDSENVRPTSFAEQPRTNIVNSTQNSQLQQQFQQQQQQIQQQQIQQQLYDTPTKRPPEKKTATFADLPNTTTWRQQQQQQQQNPLNENIPTQGLLDFLEKRSTNKWSIAEEGQVMAAQLHNIRLKLEEKRRHIENDKKRTEVALSKQRQKVGKAAFLQAVTKVLMVTNTLCFYHVRWRISSSLLV